MVNAPPAALAHGCGRQAVLGPREWLRARYAPTLMPLLVDTEHSTGTLADVTPIATIERQALTHGCDTAASTLLLETRGVP